MDASSENRNVKWKVAASAADFVAAALSALAIVFLFTVIVSLIGWLKVDLQEVFKGLAESIKGAIVMGN